MKIESVIYISRIIEQENNRLEYILPNVFQMDDYEQKEAEIKKRIETNAQILRELKTEIEFIEQYGEKWASYDPNLLLKKRHDKIT